jgi:hypothetical protein
MEIENGFLDVFGKLEDPRREHRKWYPMAEILFVTLCSCVAAPKAELIGIPSDDTFRRFFRAIAPEQFQKLFVEWIRVWLNPDVAENAIDGKMTR